MLSERARLASWLYSLARSSFAGRLTGFVFSYATFLLPMTCLYKTDTLLAFYHPRPAYPVHILLVPRRPRAGLTALSAADADFMTDLFAAVRYLVTSLDLEQGGYRLIANGGAYQDVPHLHFHLVAEQAPGAAGAAVHLPVT